MISFNEFVWLVTGWRRNRGKVAARCLECGTIDWWPKTTPEEKRICFACYIELDCARQELRDERVREGQP